MLKYAFYVFKEVDRKKVNIYKSIDIKKWLTLPSQNWNQVKMLIGHTLFFGGINNFCPSCGKPSSSAWNILGENIIATTKIQNNYGAIQSFKFPLLLL